MKGRMLYPMGKMVTGNVGLIIQKLRQNLILVQASIAGGCLRDMKVGREPKDFDLVCHRGHTSDDVYKAMKAAFKGDCKLKKNFQNEGEYENLNNINNVIKVQLYGGYDIDIIEYEEAPYSLYDVPGYFDLSINAIATNGWMVLDYSPEKGEQVKLIDTDNLNWKRMGNMYQKTKKDFLWEDAVKAFHVINPWIPPEERRIFAQVLGMAEPEPVDMDIRQVAFNVPWERMHMGKQAKPNFLNERNNWRN